MNKHDRESTNQNLEKVKVRMGKKVAEMVYESEEKLKVPSDREESIHEEPKPKD